MSESLDRLIRLLENHESFEGTDRALTIAIAMNANLALPELTALRKVAEAAKVEHKASIAFVAEERRVPLYLADAHIKMSAALAALAETEKPNAD